MEDSTAPERWLPIPGWEGSYEVSDLGRVRSVDRIVRYRDGRVRRYEGALLTAGLNDQGRPVVVLSKPSVGRNKTRKIHALVLLAFVGPRPEGMEGCHWNGDRSDNRLTNLRWGTRSENQFDAVRHGTHVMTARSECPRKHVLAAPNLVVHSAAKRHRECLACRRATVNGQHELSRGRPFDFEASADRYYREIMSGTARGKMAGRTHCPRNHPLELPNLVPCVLRDGRRSCWACARAAGRQHSARRSGREIDFVAVADECYEQIMRHA